MIKVKIHTTPNNSSLSLSIRGHAGAAEVGQDLVCASASILAYTLAQLIKDYANKDMLKGKAKILMRKGSSTITCIPKEEYWETIAYTFYVIQTGLNLLAHNYPQYIVMTEMLDIGVTP